MAHVREPALIKPVPPSGPGPLLLLEASWPWALAATAGLGLVLALGLVVQNAVRQADLRHADTAARSDALWRCNGLPGRDAREACRREATTVTAGTVR